MVLLEAIGFDCLWFFCLVSLEQAFVKIRSVLAEETRLAHLLQDLLPNKRLPHLVEELILYD